MSGSFETFDRAKKTVDELAEKAFAEHELQSEGEGRWLCRNPKRSDYWFRVIQAAGALIILGDVGDAIISSPSAQDPEWQKQAAGDWQYLVSKVTSYPRDGRREEFFPGNALEALDELTREEVNHHVRDLVLAARRLAEMGELTQHALYELAQEHRVDSDWISPALATYTPSSLLWIVWTVKTFVRLRPI